MLYLKTIRLIQKDISQSLTVFFFTLAIVFTFGFQNRSVGWEESHHGWVSSHGLAIIRKATVENYFVGHARTYIDEQNLIEYDYFDRYPFFFSAGFNLVLSIKEGLSTKVYIAKQVMNLIYLGTMGVAFFFLKRFVVSPAALAVTLLTFANPRLLYYKDMVHYDQPALFGFLFLVLAILIYKWDGVKWPLYVVALLAVSLGRGYASIAIIFLWLSIESLHILKKSNTSYLGKIQLILKHDALKIAVIAVTWVTILLTYNLVIEAKVRNVLIQETSIFASAQDRLSLNESFNEKHDHILNWSYFSRTQINRVIRWSFPLDFTFLEDWVAIMIFSFLTLLIVVFIKKSPRERKIPLILMAFSGFVWLFPMRNMAAPHDYTSMFYVGFPLVMYLSVFAYLKPGSETIRYILVMSFLIFASNLSSTRTIHNMQAKNDSVNEYTYDFMEIIKHLEGSGNKIHWASSVKNSPYAPGFYLPTQYIAPIEIADYIVSRDREFDAKLLTPQNTRIYLFEP